MANKYSLKNRTMPKQEPVIKPDQKPVKQLQKERKIGIGITTRNRRKLLNKTLKMIKGFSHNCKIVVVDDASDLPVENATFRFEENVGISKAKNKCLELLDDCTDIFLFDDDCYPKRKDWYLPYIEASEKTGISHFCFTFDKLNNGARNGNDLSKHETINGVNISVYKKACGCMLYFNIKCLQEVGGFDEDFGLYGKEHLELSERIFNKGLNPYPFVDIRNSLSIFHSHDYYGRTQSSVPNKHEEIEKNKVIYEAKKGSTEKKAYKELNNVVICAYLTGSQDPQRKKKWNPKLSALHPLIESCNKHCIDIVVLHDCFDNVDGLNAKFIRVKRDEKRPPNNYRWELFMDYLSNNSFDGVFLVDSTDVVMLQNPFEAIDKGVLYSGDEETPVKNKWMESWQEPKVTMPDYRGIIEINENHNLLNCGLVGGKQDIVMEYLERVNEYQSKCKINQQTSVDMAIHNYVIFKHFNDRFVFGIPVNTVFRKNDIKNNEAWFKHK